MPRFEEKPNVRTAGCFLEHEGKFLILHRCLSRPQGGKWGLPAGRVEEGETEKEAVIREVHEETGFLMSPGEVEFLCHITFDFSEKILDYFAYRIELPSKIDVVLNPEEHQEYDWVSGEECYARGDLIDGAHFVLKKTGYVS